MPWIMAGPVHSTQGACPAEAVDAECARYQVQSLGDSSSFPTGTWWLAEGVGLVVFSKGRGVGEAECVLVEWR